VRVPARLDVAGTAQSGDAPLSAIEIACCAAEALTASGATSRPLKAGAPAPGFNPMPTAVRCR
jgi:hypothetical protein